MWYLIQMLIFGHVHKWKIINTKQNRGTWEQGNVILKGPYTTYTCQCERCGEIKCYSV